MLFNNVSDVVEIDNPMDPKEQMDLLRRTGSSKDRQRLAWKLIVMMGVPKEAVAFYYDDFDVIQFVGEMDIALITVRGDIQKRIAGLTKTIEAKQQLLAYLIGVLEIPASFLVCEIKVIDESFGWSLKLERARFDGSMPQLLNEMGYEIDEPEIETRPMAVIPIATDARMPLFIPPQSR